MKPKIQEDLKTAMKARDQMLVDTLRGLLSELNRYELDTQIDLTQETFTAVVQKEIKKRRDAIEIGEKAGRPEFVEQNQAELKLLQKYLGEQLSEEQLAALIQNAITGGADNLGKVMGFLNKEHKGKFEGKIASELAKKLLTPAAS
ncbi:MAG: GatB/YqeY domain-containing protein [Deltaproteobacteria bacterium]|nr:GatB/YqeY domain-containing protein [Deltaproteobacteria bacterium]